VDVCSKQDLKQSEVEAWMDTFVKAGERGLKARAEDEQPLTRLSYASCGPRLVSSCSSWTREKN